MPVNLKIRSPASLSDAGGLLFNGQLMFVQFALGTMGITMFDRFDSSIFVQVYADMYCFDIESG